MNILAENFLKKLDALPEFLDINDLIGLGLYSHKNIAYRARKKGNSPSYVKVSPRKILFPKESVRQFIMARFHDGERPMGDLPSEETK